MDKFVVKDVLQQKEKRDLVTLKQDETVENALKLLTDHRISSSPVINQAGQVTAQVDIDEILRFMLNSFPEDAISEEQQKLCQNEMKTKTVSYILGIILFLYFHRLLGSSPQKGKFHPLEKSSPLKEAVSLLGDRVHRIIIIDFKTGKLVDILRQECG